MNEPKPGSFGLSIIGGKTGQYVAAGQAIAGDGSRWTHAFLVLDNGEIIEGMPHGARIVPLSERADDEGGVVFCDRPVLENAEAYYNSIKPRNIDSATLSLHMKWYVDALRADIVREARKLVGTPYNYLDYLALGLAHFKIKANWLRRFMQSKKHMICSQLVDEVYRRVGIHIFDDGRLPMDVTPGDLANRYGLT